MHSTRLALSVTAAIVAVAALAVGSEAVAVLVVALVALAALAFAGRDRPITPANPSLAQRWYLWLASAAAAFLVGLGVVAITEQDGGLSEAAWATWMLSWAAAVVLALIGVGLGATRLVTRNRT